MGSARTGLRAEQQETPSLAEILEQYECGPIRFTGTGDALYERHLMFDNVIARSAVGPRERYEATARSIRDVLSQRWLRTEENNYLSTPIERVRKMPRRAQELLGFGIHDGIERGEGFLGALDNRNPADMLTAGEI